MSNENREMARALMLSAEFNKGLSRWVNRGEANGAVDALTSELDAAEQRGREKALEEAARVAEGGSFLHDEAPDARFGRECAMAIRRLLGSTGGGR